MFVLSGTLQYPGVVWIHLGDDKSAALGQSPSIMGQRCPQTLVSK